VAHGKLAVVHEGKSVYVHVDAIEVYRREHLRPAPADVA
jgi:hypothetical protein